MVVPTRSDKDKLAKKKIILDNAIAVFLDKGYEETRISEIVKRSGIAQGTFYLYYSSKEEVFIAAAERFFSKLLGELEGVLETETALVEKLENTIDRMTFFVQKNKELMTLLHSPVASSILSRQDISEQLDGKVKELIGKIAAQIDEGIKKGEVRNCQPEITAFILFSAVHEVLETATITFPSEIIEHVVNELKGFLKAALLPHGNA